MPALLLGALAPILDRIFGAIFPDPAARQKAVADVLQQLATLDLAQLGVNAEEAKHPSIFVAGWRPFIGWVCGAAFAYQYILLPLGMFIGFATGHLIPRPPDLSGDLVTVLLGMLGLGAMRSYEKIKGAA